MDLVSALLHLLVSAPQLVVVVAWWLAARWGKRAGVQWWWLGLPVVLLHLYKNRRDLRGMILWVAGFAVAAVWVGLVLNPRTRWSVAAVVPFAVSVYGSVWLASNYGHLPVRTAMRVAVAERRSREVVVDAVTASVGDQAKVLEVKELGGGDFEAVVVGPAGMPHGDLVDALRGSIAESILRQSGRVMRNVDVVSSGARGRVRLRCGTHDPYSQTMTLGEVLGR